jgi:hypothetical protein
MARQAALHKSKALLFLFFALPFVIVFFITLLALQAKQVHELHQEINVLTLNSSAYKLQAEFYKKAYDVTLHDVMMLSDIYGGKQKYAQAAGRLRAQELSVVYARHNISGPTYSAKNPGLWSEYVQQGVIKTACLPVPYSVTTVTDEALLVLTATSEEESDLFIYLDGNIVARFPVIDRTTHLLNLYAPDGLHELTLLSKTGGMQINEIYFDTQQMPLNWTVADGGESWGVFDCEDAHNSSLLLAPGAFRVLFEKS